MAVDQLLRKNFWLVVLPLVATAALLNAQAVIEGARKGFPDMARSGGKDTAKSSEAQLTKCFDDAFKKAESYAAVVKTGLDQAQAVKDEATK